MSLRKLFMYMIAFCLVASCTSDDDFGGIVSEPDGDIDITINVEPFSSATDAKTRAYFTDLDNGDNDYDFGFKFESGDTLGILCTDSNINVPVVITKAFSVGRKLEFKMNQIILDKLNLGSKETHSFVIYYPYNARLNYDVVYRRAFQFRCSAWPIQEGNDNSKWIAKNIHYVSDPIRSKNPSDFKAATLRPLEGVVHLNVILPAGEYANIGLQSVNESGAPINSVGYVSLDSIDMKYVESEVAGKSISVDLLNFLAEDDEDDEEVCTYDFYMLSLPFSSTNFRVQVTNNEGVTYYSKEVYPLEMKSGKCYYIGSVEFDFPEHEKYEYVDFDLPSGTKWATMNVGAKNVFDYGCNFAWGETITFSGHRNDWSQYDFYEYGSDDMLTKYNRNDKILTLEPQDDVACKNWKGKWHTPTYDDFFELYQHTYWVRTDNYMNSGVGGYIVYKANSLDDRGEYTADIDPHAAARYNFNFYNIKHIFLPSERNSVGNTYYMTSSVYKDDSALPSYPKCYSVYFWNYGRKDISNSYYGRYWGYAVRPVFK